VAASPDSGPVSLQCRLATIALSAGQASDGAGAASASGAALGGGLVPASSLQRLLGELELLRPALLAQWGPPAGETVEARSWEELCMLVSPGSAPAPGGGGLVFCGAGDADGGLGAADGYWSCLSSVSHRAGPGRAGPGRIGWTRQARWSKAALSALQGCRVSEPGWARMDPAVSTCGQEKRAGTRYVNW
jgi:hypothetical protein